MDVIGHNDEGVELIVALYAVRLEDIEEQLGVRCDLKESSTIGADGGYEECPDLLWSERHSASLPWNTEFGRIPFVMSG